MTSQTLTCRSEVVTAPEVARAIDEVAITDAPALLLQLATRLRREHPGDHDADVIARQAELKRRRIVTES